MRQPSRRVHLNILQGRSGPGLRLHRLADADCAVVQTPSPAQLDNSSRQNFLRRCVLKRVITAALEMMKLPRADCS